VPVCRIGAYHHKKALYVSDMTFVPPESQLETTFFLDQYFPTCVVRSPRAPRRQENGSMSELDEIVV